MNTTFTQSLKALIPRRFITGEEYLDYFDFMEQNSIKSKDLLLIIGFCAKQRGEEVSHDYILEAFRYFAKWHTDSGFEVSAIIFAANTAKIKNLKKLDTLIMELFSANCFSEKEIANYLTKKTTLKRATTIIANELAVYCNSIESYADNFVEPWTVKGFDPDTLIKIASYCRKEKMKSFEAMDDFIEQLFELRITTSESVDKYISNLTEDDAVIKKLLSAALIDRRPTRSERKAFRNWREWGFSDEMILEAQKLAAGKNKPFAYMNVVLSGWKANDVMTVDKIPQPRQVTERFKAAKFGNERHYTKEDYENFFDNIDEIDF